MNMDRRQHAKPSEYLLPEQILTREGYDPARCLFLDIETTGFSPSTSRIYLIGMAMYDGSCWRGKQLFASGSTDEAVILRSFANFAGQYSVLIHFNGDQFDIPFLLKRMERLSVDNRISEMVSVDLYRRFRPLKNFLGLTNMNQKSLETFLGLEREDIYDGGALIKVYHHFCREYDEESLRLLFLHNREDVEGLLALTGMFGYTAFREARDFYELTLTMQEASAFYENGFFKTGILDFLLPEPVPVPIVHIMKIQNGSGNKNNTGSGNRSRKTADLMDTQTVSIRLAGEKGQLVFPVFWGTLYHFFPDYRHYDYLPLEDMAIHRSVSAYVDKEYRQRATRQNCYVKKTGCFFPQPGPVYEPVFQTDCDSCQYWFEYVPDGMPEDFLSKFLSLFL